jgi:hypothetical protein
MAEAEKTVIVRHYQNSLRKGEERAEPLLTQGFEPWIFRMQICVAAAKLPRCVRMYESVSSDYIKGLSDCYWMLKKRDRPIERFCNTANGGTDGSLDARLL